MHMVGSTPFHLSALMQLKEGTYFSKKYSILSDFKSQIYAFLDCTGRFVGQLNCTFLCPDTSAGPSLEPIEIYQWAPGTRPHIPMRGGK